MRMFVTFLLLTEPASMNPKPAWEKESSHHNEDLEDMVNLHQDDDGSTDNEEKAVQVGSDILSVLRKILSIKT